MKNRQKYLERIGLSATEELDTDLATLSLIMEKQSRSIAFENFDVVLGKTISMIDSDVERKLVDSARGGYCWELNTLLKMVLEDIGFQVTPLICRVRWGKPNDAEGPNTTFTHFALKVAIKGNCGVGFSHYLADVGFAGINSMKPISLNMCQEP